MSTSIAMFYALALSLPSGYSYGAALLFLGVLYSLVRGRCDVTLPYDRQDRILCLVLLSCFLVPLVAVLWHGDSMAFLDQPLRYVLVIPILIGLRRISIRLHWVWAGIAIGLVTTAGVAWWQVHDLKLPRATGFVTSAIPFSNLSLTMTFWAALGAYWAGSRGRFAWMGLMAVAALCGLYAVLASATRGSWIALPIMLVLPAIAVLRRRHLRRVFAASIVIIVAAMVVFATVPVGEMAAARYAGAVEEWDAYVIRDDATNNVGLRIEAWKAALLSIAERPLLGWGQQEYSTQLDHLIQSGRVDPAILVLANTHNNFIEVWLHQGSLGLLALLAMLISSFWFFCQRLRSTDLTVRVLACCGAGLPAAFACYGLTHYILGRNNGVMFFAISLAVLWALMRQAEQEAVSR
ncbi:O-antigen ligase family protein [Castellaniella sp. FW104-16D08]|uniref:O-antigen ligase family protein n=1 Tax=unclassified Castellaniella TaxID=2617606 RepID=UPI00331543BA